MTTLSCGLLVYRVRAGAPEVLLVHPGGPYFAGRDEGWWSLPKGERSGDEDPRDTAAREFREELGTDAPEGEWLDLGELRQPSGKRVRAFAVEGDLDAQRAVSNTFTLEWPPRSGRLVEFPEVDRAAWEPLERARAKLGRGQVPFLDRLESARGSRA